MWNNEKCFFTFIIVVVMLLARTNLYVSCDVTKHCSPMSWECLSNYYRDFILPRREAVKVGHTTKLTLENGEVREMRTLSMKPPIFEIPNYLSAEECNDIIQLAKQNGLEMSRTKEDNVYDEDMEEDRKELFEYYDYNKDNYLDVDEVLNLFDTEMDFYPDKDDVKIMFKKLNFDKNGDSLIDIEEFQKIKLKDIIGYASKIKKNKPHTKSRNSNQTWLDTNDFSINTLQSLRRRLQILTQLPQVLLNASESLQVVSYNPGGHYNCHVDSDDIEEEQKCCHLNNDEENCRICRYLTVLYFLNDVEEGGETAFPIADNETFNEDVWQKDVNRACNVGRNCFKSNLRVRPEKGKAIMWYSHVINNDTQWLGDSDPLSVHGGCDVIKGQKWIANNWITVSEDRNDDIKLWSEYFLNSIGTNSNSKNEDMLLDDLLDNVESEDKQQKGINEIFESLELSDALNSNRRNEL